MSDLAKRPQFLGPRPQDSDDASHFSHDELVAAMRLVSSSETDALDMVAALVTSADGAPLSITQFTTDTLTLISLLSPDAAHRVQRVLGETDEQASARVRAMRLTLGLD